MKRNTTGKYIIAFLIIFAVWSMSHLFSLGWGLPSPYEFGCDTTSPRLDGNAQVMMKDVICCENLSIK